MENNKDIETPKFVKELVEKVKTSEKLENTINSSRLSHSFYNRSSNFSLDLSREEIIEAKLKVSLENKVQFEIDSKVKEKINPMVEERIETIVQEMLKEMIEERIEFEAKMNMVGMNKATIEKNGASIREEIRTTRGESIKEYLIKNKGEEIATLSNNISQSIRKEILKEKVPL